MKNIPGRVPRSQYQRFRIDPFSTIHFHRSHAVPVQDNVRKLRIKQDPSATFLDRFTHSRNDMRQLISTNMRMRFI